MDSQGGKQNMKVHIAQFTKSNGEVRTMKYILLEDLPREFLETKIKNTGKKPNLKENMKLVWDIEANDFRILNTLTLLGEIKTLDMDFDSWHTSKAH